jgi:integrase
MPKKSAPLTQKQIDAARYAAGGKNKLFDGDGLFLWLQPTGAKWWRFKYRRPKTGKENLLAFGTYPDVSLKKARTKRGEARALLADEIDPGEQRKEKARQERAAAENSFEAVAREWHGKFGPTWTQHHSDDVRRRLEKNLYPEFGTKPISEITAPMLLAAARKVESRGAHDLAHRMIGVASQVFRYAIATGRCERDPAPDLRGALTPHRKKHQPAVKPEELPALLRAIDGYPAIGDGQTALALRLLCLTFVRTNELIGAEWAEIDIDAGIWIVPAERMKMKTEHVVPLSTQAVALLRELQVLACGSRYVLPGRNSDKPISNNTLLFALYRLGYKGKMTGHGFRTVASTILNESGFRLDVIERQLAHCERNAVRGAYNRAEYLPERQAMLQQWADMVDALAQGAKVIPLQRRS